MPGRVVTRREGTGGEPPEAALARAEGATPAYHDLSILEPPVWKWEIAHYFFWGGLSAGAFLMARVAERCGGGRFGELTRMGTFAALAASLPCAPLLIRDLGDPGRFHHMLRVWKPSSPMNLGAWTLTGYSGVVTAAAARELLRAGAGRGSRGWAAVAIDGSGIPLALLMAGYAGVLLSCTANPLWVRSPWIGPLFTSSAIATGAEATSLLLDAVEPGGRRATARREAAHAALERVDTLAHAAEGVALLGFARHAGRRARPWTRGSQRRHLAITVGGLVIAEALKILPLGGRGRRAARVAAALVGLVAGLSLRWGIVHGGVEAARDPDLAREATARREGRGVERIGGSDAGEGGGSAPAVREAARQEAASG